MSGAILGPVVLLLAFVGGISFQFAIAAAVAVGLGEWLKITTGRRWNIFAPASFIVLQVYRELGTPAAIACVALFALVIAASVSRSFAGGRGQCAFGTIAFGFPYVCLPLLALVWLRDGTPAGWRLVFFVLVVIWGTDVGAYFAGRLLGGPRLAPRISPKKTWSGAVGGLFSAMLVALIWGQFYSVTPGSVQLVAVAIVLSFVGQCGDLFESAMKRRYGVKDSGDLIPGHGGLLDRVDGLMFAALAIAAARLVYKAGWAH